MLGILLPDRPKTVRGRFIIVCMSGMVEASPVLEALARLEAAEAEFAAVSLDLCSDAEMLEVLRRREASKRRAAWWIMR